MKMDYDVVVSAGCSFMQGDAIVDEDGKHIGYKYTAGKVLGDYLNCDVNVIAGTGYSNDRILNTVYEWVEKNTKYKKPLFLIGTSGLGRYQIYNEITGKHWDISPVSIIHEIEKHGDKSSLTLGSFQRKITSDLATIDEIYQWLKFYLKYIYSEKLAKKTLQRNVVMLHHYLKNNNCDYFIHNSLEDCLGEIKSKINYVSFLDENYNGVDTWKEYLKWQMKNIDNEDINKTELYRSPKPPHGKRFCLGHPSPNSNKELAERIYKEINK